MYSKHFNLEQPEENYLNEAFTAYTKMKLGENEMRDRLAADFPMLDDRYIHKAEELLHNMFRPTNVKEDYTTKIDWIRFCTSAEYTDPSGSWSRKQFIRKLCPSVYAVLHIRNYAYGTYGCNQKYRVYGEDRAGKSVLLKEIDVKLDKNDLCRDYMVLIDLDDAAPAVSAYSQELDIIAKVVIDGQEYAECYERLTIINTPEAGIEFNGWEMSSGLEGSSSDLFNLHDTLLISNDISVDARYAGCNGELDFIEAEVIIWHSNLYRKMFRSTVRLEHVGGGTYRFKAPLVVLKYDKSVLAEAEMEKEDIVPVHEWSCGSFDATLTVWGKEIASSKVCFHDKGFHGL